MKLACPYEALAKYGAEEGTRTPTGFLPQPPQGCVYTSFTTSAISKISKRKCSTKKCANQTLFWAFCTKKRLFVIFFHFLFNINAFIRCCTSWLYERYFIRRPTAKKPAYPIKNTCNRTSNK